MKVGAAPQAETSNAGRSLTGWLGACAVDGLLHCSCAYHAQHPDVIDCIGGQPDTGEDTRAPDAPRPAG